MTLAKKAAANTLWSVLLFWARFGINAVVFVLLARWLSTGEIGAYGVAFSIVQIFIAALTSGFPEAVIRDDGKTHGYADTAHTLALVLGGTMSLLLVALAHPLAGLYDSPTMAQYTMMLAIVPAAAAFGVVAEGLIRSGLALRNLAIRTTITLTLAGIAAIWLAASGYGGLALVAFTIVNNVLAAILNYALAPTRPRVRIDPALFHRVLADTASIGLRGVVKSLLNPVLILISGLFLGTAASGELYIAIRFVTILSSLTMMPAQFVSLPFFSKVQDQPEKRARALREAAGTMSLVTAPLYLGALATAPILLPLIFEDNGPAVLLLVQSLLLQSAPLVLNNLGFNALTSVGKKNLALRYTLVQLVGTVLLSMAASQFSIEAVGLAYAAQYYLLMPWLIAMLAQNLGGSASALALAVMRPWIAGAAMAAFILILDQFWLNWTPFSGLFALHLVTMIALGGVIYISLALGLARPEVGLLFSRLRQLRRP